MTTECHVDDEINRSDACDEMRAKGRIHFTWMAFRRACRDRDEKIVRERLDIILKVNMPAERF